jgi:creatinine amidohydrolase
MTIVSGVSIFADTMADMTAGEVAAAASAGAVALWAFGVIEQHGPHLPCGTDVYLPSARLRRIRAILQTQSVPSVIVPPYYWGVNVVSRAFPASPAVRPAVMIELMADVFASLADNGFRHVFCVSGHGDAEHNRTIHAGILRGTADGRIGGSFLAEAGLARRLGFAATDPHMTLFEHQRGAVPGGFADVHAGAWETSDMLALYPELVRQDVVPTLRSTDFTPEDLEEWRLGEQHSVRKAPHGYVGDPAAANAAQGAASIEAGAQAAAAAIIAHLRGGA